MMGLSFQHVLLFALVALLFFGGRGKISEIMGDFAKGIRSFKKGLNEDDEAPAPAPTPAPAPRTLENRSTDPVGVGSQEKVG